MRRRFAIVSALLTLAALLALPSSLFATGSYSWEFVHNYCGGPYNWTTFAKVNFTADTSSSANKLTIDSWVLEEDPGHPHWHRVQTWPQVQTTFTPDGTVHQLAAKRKVYGGVDSDVKIAFKMQAWDHGLVVWTKTVKSVAC